MMIQHEHEALDLSNIACKPGIVCYMFSVVPVLGWIVSNEIDRRRVANGTQALCTQLLTREADASQAWSESTVEPVARVVCKCIATVFGWPTSAFIPADPMEAVLFNSDCQLTDLLELLEETLKIEKWWLVDHYQDHLTDGTLLDFVSWVASCANCKRKDLAE